MKLPAFGVLSVLFASLSSCNNASTEALSGESDISSSGGSAAGSASIQRHLSEACALLNGKKMKGLEQEMGVACRGGAGTSLAMNLLVAAYDGANSIEAATKEVKIESRGDDTEIVFAGAVKVDKSLAEVRGLTKSILEMTMDDPKNGVSVSGKILSGPVMTKGGACYVRKESVSTAVLGLKIEDSSVADACSVFLGSDRRALLSSETLRKDRSENNDNPVGNKVILYLEVGPRTTYVLSIARKSIKNKGFASIAEAKARTQPQPLMAKFQKTLAARKPVTTISSDGPKFGDAVDNDHSDNGDWAQGRTKLACNQGDGVVSVLQERVYGKATHTPAILTLECREVAKPQGFRVEEPPRGIPIGYEIACQGDEYVAGVSFVRYNDKATLLADGTRSLLCAKMDKPLTSCSWKERSCGVNGVLRGLRAKREGGLICAGRNSADIARGCYTVESVYCCE